jgi:hypothetical protein
MLHSHQQELNQFIQDSAAQWDPVYTVNRYSQSRALENLFPTPELQQNIDAAKLEDGGNLPLPRNGTGGRIHGVEDELSINDLQIHLSNQAARLRMNMTSEYEDLRLFQVNEMDALLKAKVKQEPEFSKLVEEVRIHGNRPPRPPPLNPTSRATPMLHSSAVQQTMSPVLYHSPLDLPDLNQLKNEPSLSSFIKFFLHLHVVQQNWAAISRNWTQYVVIFQRGLMTEKAFAKAILEDAVRTNQTTKFIADPKHVQGTREVAKVMPESMHMSKIIAEVVLEMAEAGDVEFTHEEKQEETFGPKILFDVVRLEDELQKQGKEDDSTGAWKARDPRQQG